MNFNFLAIFVLSSEIALNLDYTQTLSFGKEFSRKVPIAAN